MLPLALLVSTFALGPVDVAGLRLEPPRLMAPVVAAAPFLPRLLDGALKGRVPDSYSQEISPGALQRVRTSSVFAHAYLVGAGLYVASELLGGYLFGVAPDFTVLFPTALFVVEEVALIAGSLVPLLVAVTQADLINRALSRKASAVPGALIGLGIELGTMGLVAWVTGAGALDTVFFTVAPGLAALHGVAPQVVLPLLVFRYVTLPLVQLLALQLSSEPTNSPSPVRGTPNWPSPTASIRDATRPLVFDAVRVSF